MQSHRIAIRAQDHVAIDPGIVPCLRNLAEDVYRALRDKRFATIQNMDSATDTIWIDVHSTGKLRETQRIVRDCLGKSGMWDRCDLLIDPPV